MFKGNVEVESPSGNVIVEKKKTATFDADDKSTVAGNIVEAPFDSWDKEAISYHDQYAREQFLALWIWRSRPELLRLL